MMIVHLLLPMLLQITATAAAPAAVGADGDSKTIPGSINNDEALLSSEVDLYSIAECSSRLANLATSTMNSSNSSIVYFVLLDAGSTGTRAVVNKFNLEPKMAFKFAGSVGHKKRKPGLSAFGNSLHKVKEQVTKLLEDAAATVPAEVRPYTCLLLRATAGFRLMDARARHLVAKKARDVLRTSEFCVPALGSVRMLTGAEEGKFTWLSVNYLLGRINGGDSTSNGLSTRPVMELGGGSLQLAYEIKAGEELVSGSHIRAVSYLGLGIQESVLRFLRHNGSVTEHRSACLARNVSLKFRFGDINVQIVGTGRNNDENVAESCLTRGRQVISEMDVKQEPPVNQQENWPIYAISGFYYLLKYLHGAKTRIGRVANACANESSVTCQAYTATVGDLANAAKDMCLELPTKGKYEPYYCINFAVISALLTEGWKLNTTAPLVALGKQDALGWPLGLSLHHLSWQPAPPSPMEEASCPPQDQSKEITIITASTAKTAPHPAVTIIALAVVSTASSIWRMLELHV